MSCEHVDLDIWILLVKQIMVSLFLSRTIFRSKDTRKLIYKNTKISYSAASPNIIAFIKWVCANDNATYMSTFSLVGQLWLQMQVLTIDTCTLRGVADRRVKVLKTNTLQTLMGDIVKHLVYLHFYSIYDWLLCYHIL